MATSQPIAPSPTRRRTPRVNFIRNPPVTINGHIIAMLEKSVDALKQDLTILQPQMQADGAGMFITHNDKDMIIVYAQAKYKAYIPKKYDLWNVQFIEWDGQELDIDLDVNI